MKKIKKPSIVLFDLDNTLYDYDSAHNDAIKAVSKKVKNLLNIDEKEFIELYEEAKQIIKKNHEINKQLNSGLVESSQEIFSFIKDKRHKTLYKDSKNIKIIQEAMFASTNEARGTSYSSRIKNPKYQFAGKTGTSQVKRITAIERKLDLNTSEIPYNERDHALFIAFGPYKNPRYSLSIVIEHGGSGSSTAAPIAKKLFKLIIDRHKLREKIRNQKTQKI